MPICLIKHPQPAILFVILLFMTLVNVSAQNATNTPTVGQWDRFEVKVPTAKTYADPYRDVQLRVVYTRPDGQRVNFWGFFDGSRGWNIRFMPDQTGIWTYTATFSDGSPGSSGNFRCVRSTIPGMLSHDAVNPRWFGFKGGQPVQLRSFHAGPIFDYGWDDPDDPNDGEKRCGLATRSNPPGRSTTCAGLCGCICCRQPRITSAT